MNEADARRLFASRRVARLATVRDDGAPHLVPICFALEGDTLYSAVDHKPKRSRSLQRLANIVANPRVTLLADHYDEDWSTLWWVRADGIARLAEVGEPAHVRAVELLRSRYAQYRDAPPLGTAIVVELESFSGWRAS
ncbi:MAG TPA: TIGR03668 family PPOX class F420-dependent oxidoreductase [Gaiellales bacterium]